METIMNRNYIKLLSLLLLVSPIASFAMEAPPAPSLANEDAELALSRSIRVVPISQGLDKKLIEYKNPRTSLARKLELARDPEVMPYLYSKNALDALKIEPARKEKSPTRTPVLEGPSVQETEMDRLIPILSNFIQGMEDASKEYDAMSRDLQVANAAVARMSDKLDECARTLSVRSRNAAPACQREYGPCDVKSSDAIKKLAEFKNPLTPRERKLQLLPDVAPFINIHPMRVGEVASNTNFSFTQEELDEATRVRMVERLERLDQTPCIQATTVISDTGRQKKHYSSPKRVEVGSYAIIYEEENLPTQTERLQAYWNNLHPAVKAGVVGVGAIATCSAAKKLYDFLNK